MENVENNQETTEIKDKLLGGVTGKGFMPGVSGNPGGRPKNPLKDFQRDLFAVMSKEEKMEFLKDVQNLDRWKMAEGNPDAKIDAVITDEGTHLTPEALAVAKKYEAELNKLEDGKV